PALTRVEMEALLQANRGNIERCLARLKPGYFYIDFDLTQGDDGAINADVYPGEVANEGIQFMHPRLRQKDVERYAWHDRLRFYSSAKKFSVIAPEVNGCIMRTLGPDLQHYTLEHLKEGFAHRYITDKAFH